MSQKKPAAAAGRAAEALPLLRFLWQVNHGLQAASKRMAQHLGVTGPQRLVLKALSQSPGMTPGALSRELHLDPGTLTGVLGRLERDRHLRRAADPHDGRRSLLGLTESGRRIAGLKTGTIEARVDAALGRLGPDDSAAAERVLQALAEALLAPEPRIHAVPRGR